LFGRCSRDWHSDECEQREAERDIEAHVEHPFENFDEKPGRVSASQMDQFGVYERQITKGDIAPNNDRVVAYPRAAWHNSSEEDDGQGSSEQ
jgi:hypothetical protein